MSKTQHVLDQLLPIVGSFPNGRFHAEVKCDRCPATAEWTANSMPQPSVVITKIRNKGWQVSKKKVTCPQCQKAEKRVKELERITFVPVAPPMALPVPAQVIKAPIMKEKPMTSIAPTDQAKAAKRQAYGLLLDAYDDQNKRYRGDWSDQKIADQTGLSVAKVAQIREEDFGPAGPPPQLDNLKQQLVRIEDRLKAEETNILRSMESIDSLTKELQVARDDLANLLRVHKWEDA